MVVSFSVQKTHNMSKNDIKSNGKLEDINEKWKKLIYYVFLRGLLTISAKKHTIDLKR